MKNYGLPPKKLYKYTKREYADWLVKDGKTRIGTLHDFRNEELYGKGIGDENEGRKRFVTQIDSEVATANSLLGQQLKEQQIEIGDGVDVNFQNFTVETVFNHRDVYLWCCSKAFSKKTMDDIKGADTCIEIFDLSRFYDALDTAMKSRYALETLGPTNIIYRSLVEPWDRQTVNTGIHPVFLKETCFRHQYEARIAWQPLGALTPLEQFIDIDKSEAGRFCKIIDSPLK